MKHPPLFLNVMQNFYAFNLKCIRCTPYTQAMRTKLAFDQCRSPCVALGVRIEFTFSLGRSVSIVRPQPTLFLAASAIHWRG